MPLLTIRFVPTISDDAPSLVRRGIEKQKRVYVYIAVVHYLLSPYAREIVSAKPALEIRSFSKQNSQPVVKVFEALREKRCGTKTPISNSVPNLY